MVKRAGSIWFTMMGLLVFLMALQTSSLAQVVSYDEVKQKTVDQYQKEKIDYGSYRSNAMELEEKLHRSYSKRLGELCFAVRSFERRMCNHANRGCIAQAGKVYRDHLVEFNGLLKNIFKDRRDKINLYWDKMDRNKPCPGPLKDKSNLD